MLSSFPPYLHSYIHPTQLWENKNGTQLNWFLVQKMFAKIPSTIIPVGILAVVDSEKAGELATSRCLSKMR